MQCKNKKERALSASRQESAAGCLIYYYRIQLSIFGGERQLLGKETAKKRAQIEHESLRELIKLRSRIQHRYELHQASLQASEHEKGPSKRS